MPSISLLMSSAYVSQELALEFGLLPPAFLPIGTQRLYEHQIPRLGDGYVYITIPESFAPDPSDIARLQQLSALLIPVPDALSLGDAAVYAINYAGLGTQPLRLLHGDTLIDEIPEHQGDAVAIAPQGDDYSWAEVDVAEDGRITSLQTISAGGVSERQRPVACGYFAFESSTSLVRCITRAHGDFIGGLNLYAESTRVQALPVGSWLDFGHLRTFFASRREVTTQRAFNTLQIDGVVVRKSGDNHAKIRAEANWLAEVPPKVQIFAARLVDREDAPVPFYTTEYEYLPTLAELFVFGRIGRASWRRILASCGDFLRACVAHPGPGLGDTALSQIVGQKTSQRLREFGVAADFDITRPCSFDGQAMPSLSDIAQRLEAFVTLRPGRLETVMHGDLCFSNILYNSRNHRIRVLDPRGTVAPTRQTIFGDVRYDLAKLVHSVVGMYDIIIAGRYSVPGADGHRFSIDFALPPNHDWLVDEVDRFVIDGEWAGSREVRAISATFFLSMLPLHADRPDRQRAFIANALRLFADLDR